MGEVMKNRKSSLWGVLLLITLCACQRGRLDVDISGIQADTPVIRFDQLLFSVPQENLKTGILTLKEKHPDFFSLFSHQMIRIGDVEDEMFFPELTRFLEDSLIREVKKKVDSEFSDLSEIEKQVNRAFRHYAYYFPDRNIPHIYTCLSGFNQSIVLAEGLIGVSLDKYLGPDCSYYDGLGIPRYQQRKMHRERIPVDIMMGWGASEFTKNGKEKHLLSHMIYQGRLLYFLDAMFPRMQDSLKIGYTAQQLQWCEENEAQMWMSLVENKRLFSSERMDIKRLMDDSPYTKGFPVESPGRTGAWIGWQIVRKYMERNPNVSLPQLMQAENAQEILNDSRYYPG
jgi:gliding motility-associated lipoprotein GldB